MGFNVGVNSYKRTIRESLHAILKKGLRDFFSNKSFIEEVNIYDFNKEAQDHTSGKKRMLIFLNSTNEACSKETINMEAPANILGVENMVLQFLNPLGSGTLLVSQDGYPIAEWFDSIQVLNVLFDLQSLDDASAGTIWNEIVKFVDAQFAERRNQFSWTKSKAKDKLLVSIGAMANQDAESRKSKLHSKIQESESYIREYKQGILNHTRNLAKHMKDLESTNNGNDDLIKKYETDLNLIAAHPLITDVYFEDGKFEVHTDTLYITDEEGTRYLGGKFQIKINTYNSEVTFWGGNPHKSYWTSTDPHPHVKGSSGVACLGNVSSTIAELCAQHELYALVLTCVSFLESVNRDDAAGKYVRNWEKVDDEGNLIPVVNCDYHDCTNAYQVVTHDDHHRCSAHYTQAFRADGTYGPVPSEDIDGGYHYNDDLGEYVDNDYDGDENELER